jgi:hypothetical protein
MSDAFSKERELHAELEEARKSFEDWRAVTDNGNTAGKYATCLWGARERYAMALLAWEDFKAPTTTSTQR